MRSTSDCVLLATALTLASPAALAVETVLFVPAAARSAGAAGSTWTTELALFNPSRTEERQVWVRFLPRPGGTSPAETPVRLAPRAGTLLPDVVASLGTSGGGALRLRADGPLVATSRTFNSGNAACGTFGVGVPAVPASAAVTAGVFAPLHGARVNVGLVNPSETASARVHVSLRSASSAVLLGETTVDVPALGSAQIDDVLGAWAPAHASDPVVVEVSSEPAVLAWATPIDGTSGDATFTVASPDTAADPEEPGWEARFTLAPSEGWTWRVEDGLRLGGGSGVPRVIALPDGRLRLFTPGQGGMRSATSADGFTFAPDPGTRGQMGDIAVVYLRAGGWRFLWPDGAPGSHVLKSAVSTDGLAFTIEAGERMRPGPQDAGILQVPHAVRLADGRWRLYYVADWYGTGGAVNRNNTRTAVSTDEGLTWTLEAGEAGSEATGRDSVDPDVVKVTGGAFRLYYKSYESFRAAESEDGRLFPASGVAGRQVLEARERFDPTVVKLRDGTVRMFFGMPGGVGSAVATDTAPAPASPDPR